MGRIFGFGREGFVERAADLLREGGEGFMGLGMTLEVALEDLESPGHVGFPAFMGVLPGEPEAPVIEGEALAY